MSGEGVIRVDVDVLAAHRRNVVAVAAGVDEAVAAAGSLNMSGGAFGVLCAFLVPAITVVDTLAQRALASAAAGLHRAADGLGATVQDFEAVDRAAQDTVAALQGELEVYGLRGAVGGGGAGW